ncbi:G-protein coupled receptor daf-37-like [Pecten maximus]|uniref:G-protein coupled receptor daf-37-like n=1 Tax=Pecten maximus TaxID=6579 RepID=UPI00145840EA|nr:G-protein coupled receptor daf-37-like [Pecten maximus]
MNASLNLNISVNGSNGTENNGASTSHIAESKFVLYGIIFPVIVTFGYLGNILTAIVLWKKEMASTNNILLRALVLSDIAMITTGLVALSCPMLLTKALDFDLVVNVLNSLAFSTINYLMMTSQQFNVYVLVSISVERYIAVCHPLSYANYKSRGRTIALLCGIICCSVVYNIPRLLATTVDPTTCINANSSFTCYEIVYTEFGEGYFYQEVYSVWIYGATYFVIPLAVLLIMNIFIIKELTKMRNIRRNLGVVNSSNAQKDSISQSLVIIMSVFGVVQTLGFFNQFPNLMSDGIDKDHYRMIVNTLYAINSSINILIYVAVGKKFRRNVTEFFKECFHCPSVVASSGQYQVHATGVNNIRVSVLPGNSKL